MRLFLALAAVGFLLLRESVSVENLSAVMKRVTVGNRSYLVTRLGGGAYSVVNDKTLAQLSFNQSGELESTGDTTQLRADMMRFPKGLFL